MERLAAAGRPGTMSTARARPIRLRGRVVVVVVVDVVVVVVVAGGRVVVVVAGGRVVVVVAGGVDRGHGPASWSSGADGVGTGKAHMADAQSVGVVATAT